MPKCGEKQGVKLPSEKHPEATCKNGLGERSDLIGGAKSCKGGKKKNSRGKCVKTVAQNKPKKKVKGSNRGVELE